MSSVLSLDLLRLFVAIHESGSISAAARICDLSPSLATRKLAALEEAVEMRLFHRTTRALHLTEAGRLVLAWAVEALEGHASLATALTGLKSEIGGLIRIALSDHAAGTFLAPFLRDFAPRHPALRFEVATTDQLFNLARAGFDVALHSGLLPQTDLVGIEIASVHRVLCASPEYLEKHGSPSGPPDLAEHACLAHGPSEPALWCFSRGAELFRQRVVPAITLDSYFALTAMAVAGLGIARISRNVVKEELATGRLVQVMADCVCTHEHGVLPSVWLLYPHRNLPRRTRVFIDSFKVYMAEKLGDG